MIALLGYTAVTTFMKNVLRHKVVWDLVNDENDVIMEPPVGKVSIVLPAWKEPKETFVIAMESLLNQNVVKAFPDRFEMVMVDGVDYVDEVEGYFDKVIHPDRPGKLAARNDGIRASSGDLIVAVDADTYYPVNWLNMHLKAYSIDGVVATTGSTFYGEYEAFIKEVVNWYWKGKMLGRCSTFYKDVFEKIGGFDEKIDPSDPYKMMWEEEFKFFKEIKKYGDIAFVDAPVVHLGVDGSPFVMKQGRGIRSDHGRV